MLFGRIFKVCPKSGRIIGIRKPEKLGWLILPLIGLVSTIWILIRVVPKPNRAEYPCMKVAAPLAASFVAFISTLAVSLFGLRRAAVAVRRRNFLIAAGFLALAACAGLLHLNVSLRQARAEAVGTFVPSDAPNSPIGTARGIVPGRVAWVWNPEATSWDGRSNYWSSPYFTNQSAVRDMVQQAVKTTANQAEIVPAWDALFMHLNQKRGKGSVGYKPGEKIAIKINLNNNSNSNKCDATPQVVRALLADLVFYAGVAQGDITVYDAQRAGIGNVQTICAPAFPNVKYNQWGGWVADKIQYSRTSDITNVADARRLPQAVVEAEYVINCALLKRHTQVDDSWASGDGQTGITVCGKNNFGTIGSPSALHETIRDWKATRGMGSYNCLVDIMGSREIGGKTLIWIIDGLYAGDKHNATPKRWLMAPFNNDWPSSIFASLDPVAIDSVALDFLRTEWAVTRNADNYLHEAALASAPPSDIAYRPDGVPLENLGVHEHWNNAVEKKYSRNLSASGTGIELVAIRSAQSGAEHSLAYSAGN